MKGVIFCEECAPKMHELGDIAYEMYFDICYGYFNEEKCYELDMRSYSGLSVIIHFLEINNYIVTTEADINKIKAKPLGIKKNHSWVSPYYEICFCE